LKIEERERERKKMWKGKIDDKFEISRLNVIKLRVGKNVLK
jgi:hypothetical protein